MTKGFKISKKIIALLVMAVMVMTMSMTAFADSTSEYKVSILKDGKSTTSMADDILVDHKATVTTSDSGESTITIKIKPIEGYIPMSISLFDPADGWLRKVDVAEAEGNEIENAKTFYSNTTWTINMPTNTVISSGTKLNANNAEIDLYKSGVNEQGEHEDYPLYHHMTKNFDILFE